MAGINSRIKSFFTRVLNFFKSVSLLQHPGGQSRETPDECLPSSPVKWLWNSLERGLNPQAAKSAIMRYLESHPVGRRKSFIPEPANAIFQIRTSSDCCTRRAAMTSAHDTVSVARDGYAELGQKKCESLNGKAWRPYRDSQNDVNMVAILKFCFLSILLSIGLLALPAHADDPLFKHKDAYVNREFVNAYSDIRNAAKNDPPVRTKAQILATTPDRAGQVYYCSDCATDAVCVSTGTAVGAFSRVSARTTACN